MTIIVNIGPLTIMKLFSFLNLKKSKFQKYMSILRNIKNTPGRPPIGRQALSVIIFLQIRNEVPGKKKALSPPSPTGDRGLSPTPGATGACRPLRGRQGPSAAVCRHSLCDLSLKIQKKTSPSRHSLCHLSLKIYEKNWSGCRVVTSF